MHWLDLIEDETNYLVSKGYAWSDVRQMEVWRRKKYCQINSRIDKIRQASAGPQQSKTIGDFL